MNRQKRHKPEKIILLLRDSEMHGDGRRRFLYREGSRPIESGRCLLIAHAGTAWGEEWPVTELTPGNKDDIYAYLRVRDGVIRSGASDRGIGADDRAGLAMLWCLRDLGHSLLVTDMEEMGRLGAEYLVHSYPELLERINRDNAFAVNPPPAHVKGKRDNPDFRPGPAHAVNYHMVK